MFNWFNRFKKKSCDHEFRVNYFEKYIDTSGGNRIPSILFSAYCLKCQRPATCHGSNKTPGDSKKDAMRFVYGCNISSKEELLKELRIE